MDSIVKFSRKDEEPLTLGWTGLAPGVFREKQAVVIYLSRPEAFTFTGIMSSDEAAAMSKVLMKLAAEAEFERRGDSLEEVAKSRATFWARFVAWCRGLVKARPQA